MLIQSSLIIEPRALALIALLLWKMSGVDMVSKLEEGIEDCIAFRTLQLRIMAGSDMTLKMNWIFERSLTLWAIM